MSASKPFSECRNRMLADPELAAMYVEEALASGEIKNFSTALLHLLEAHLNASQDKVNQGILKEQISLIGSESANLKLGTVILALKSVGLQLSLSSVESGK